MSPGLAWLIAELIKLTVDKVQQQGKYETLSEEEARQMVKQITDGLSTELPTPEDLAAGTAG